MQANNSWILPEELSTLDISNTTQEGKRKKNYNYKVRILIVIAIVDEDLESYTLGIKILHASVYAITFDR